MLRKRYCTWLTDSDRWKAYRPRSSDVLVTSYPKSGTTWLQRILSLLFLSSDEPIALDRLFPWWECNRRPIAEVAADIEAQVHRRSLKTHIPLDGLPIYDWIKYVHVARDGRDVCMSYHNHCLGFQPSEVARMDAVGIAEPSLQRPYPQVVDDPRTHFHNWLTVGAIDGQPDGTPFLSYFGYEKTFWDARGWDNLLFVHYSDLQSDPTGEIRRIADFVEADITDPDIDRIAKLATITAMRKDASKLLPDNAKNFQGGALRLVNKGQSGRWHGIYSPIDVELFDTKLRSAVPNDYAEWLLAGRIGGNGTDPSHMSEP